MYGNMGLKTRYKEMLVALVVAEIGLGTIFTFILLVSSISNESFYRGFKFLADFCPTWRHQEFNT